MTMAEKEYISREDGFNAILKLVPKVDDDGYCWVIRGDAATAIDNIPAADVRPVVLCRDCIFRSNEWTGCPKLNGTITGDDFFCKCGIKREES